MHGKCTHTHPERTPPNARLRTHTEEMSQSKSNSLGFPSLTMAMKEEDERKIEKEEEEKEACPPLFGSSLASLRPYLARLRDEREVGPTSVSNTNTMRCASDCVLGLAPQNIGDPGDVETWWAGCGELASRIRRVLPLLKLAANRNSGDKFEAIRGPNASSGQGTHEKTSVPLTCAFVRNIDQLPLYREPHELAKAMLTDLTAPGLASVVQANACRDYMLARRHCFSWMDQTTTSHAVESYMDEAYPRNAFTAAAHTLRMGVGTARRHKGQWPVRMALKSRSVRACRQRAHELVAELTREVHEPSSAVVAAAAAALVAPLSPEQALAVGLACMGGWTRRGGRTTRSTRGSGRASRLCSPGTSSGW